MELLPILEPEERPQSRQWYVVVPTGAGPGVSVGHTCTFVASSDGGKGRIVIVGGANPDGSFSDSYIINLADAEGRGLWQTVQVKGMAPSVRTYHTSSACVDDRLFVFSGGDAGASPVTDPQLHVFDTVSVTWLQPESKGTPPAPRHGHVITAVGSNIYIHGGMAGEKFYNDMFLLSTETMKWEKVRAKGDIPPGVAAHSSVTLGKNIFIFGGITADGATNAMYTFQCDKQRWTRMKFDGDLPPSRLDHSMCVVPWRVKTPEESCDTDVVHLCFIFGGMDTQGVIFNDCLVTMLT
ncbi:rab9 effector protein with kelch motifs isoform X2 [Garra rufa]|uniref:rab9 effector protein with kelch motifs isoform X2 n=1 Tax=Garra rufa TaxID=137080 RepID=UPI003CCEC43D